LWSNFVPFNAALLRELFVIGIFNHLEIKEVGEDEEKAKDEERR